MKNVRIVLDMNAENMEALMKENDLKNFDELRGYLLAILHGSGVTEESAVYDKVDVCKKPIKLNFSMERFEKAAYETTISTLELNNALLKQRNEELVTENQALRDRNDLFNKMNEDYKYYIECMRKIR